MKLAIPSCGVGVGAVARICIITINLITTVAATNLEYVTCGSVIKLVNNNYKTRLHSHDIKYGSGSGQQSVTAVDDREDGNSYWAVKGESYQLQLVRQSHSYVVLLQERSTSRV